MIRLCANLHFMYRDAPFLERFAAAAKDGFAGVEMTFPYDYAATEIRAAADRAGVPIVEFNAPLHLSNVMLVCPTCDKHTRVGYRFTDDNRKVRFCKQCDANID